MGIDLIVMIQDRHVDVKLCWKAHVKKKREGLGLNYKKIYWLVGRRSALSIHHKRMLHKQIWKTVWTCGMQLWGCTKQSNIVLAPCSGIRGTYNVNRIIYSFINAGQSKILFNFTIKY
jgi:hypothetical protein